MIHISSATTAWEMWKQLMMVKESRGRLGVLAMCWALYRATADESFEMVDYISKLRKLQEELHIMGSPVPDKDFVMILITLLLEAWDNYTSAYLGSSGNKLELQSHEIIAILLDEDQRCKGWSGSMIDSALQAKGKNKQGKGKDDSCYNFKLYQAIACTRIQYWANCNSQQLWVQVLVQSERWLRSSKASLSDRFESDNKLSSSWGIYKVNYWFIYLVSA